MIEQKKIQYHFFPVLICEMCGDHTENYKVLGQRLNQSQGLRPKTKFGISVSVKKCNNCGLIYNSPLPIPDNIQDHYGVIPEDYWIPSYFEWDESYFSKEINMLSNLQEFKPGLKALDVGAGIGKCMISLNKYGFDVYGFEPSEPFYKRAIEKMGIDPDRLSFGMIENMEYPTEYFDFITFGAVFEHLYHPAKCLEKALNWTKKGGIVHIEVPSADYLISNFINLYYKLIGTNYVTNLSPMHAPFHLYEFTLKSFELLSVKLGCSLIHKEYTVGENPLIPRIFRPILNKYMQSTNKGMQLIVWLKKN
jgi:2-polyprenyl-3-methyl-5-hydroxy-6-metoxy-1,4-benzoquinol methylase